MLINLQVKYNSKVTKQAHTDSMNNASNVWYQNVKLKTGENKFRCNL